METTTIQEYWDELNAHDWTYEYSDSHSVWLAGATSLRRIFEKKDLGKEYLDLYNAFRLWALGDDRTLDKPLKPK